MEAVFSGRVGVAPGCGAGGMSSSVSFGLTEEEPGGADVPVVVAVGGGPGGGGGKPSSI